MVGDREGGGGAARWLGWNFALAILVSAFLLFQVQPLISKSILPWFGGCPAVWATAMLFFQTALFAGYVYAHLLQRWLKPRQQATVHFLVVAAALGALLLMRLPPGPSWKPIDSSHPTWRVLCLLSASVGLPYFALSATSPLIQAWFSRIWTDRSPYRLYALSNVGSLVGLLSYPFLFEPAFDLTRQSSLWFWSFVVYGVLCAAALDCLVRMTRLESGDRAEETSPAEPVEGSVAAPSMSHRLLWLALPAAASLMLLATTNHVCQNIAVVPFLWVVPLTLYLLSFIICFDHQRWYVRGLWATAAMVALVAAAGNDEFYWFGYRLSTAQELTLYFAAMFFTCMVCHGELVRLKPDPRHLTEFYLLISAGGALGGIFVGLVAPLVFTTFFEWSIAVVASCAIAIVVIALSAPIRDILPAGNAILRRAAAIVRTLLAPAAVLGLGSIIYWQFTGWRPAVDRARNFYGVVSVFEYDRDNPQEHDRRMKHGAITHGQQYLDPARSHWATTYYSDESGVGRTIRYFRERGAVRVGVVGLGVGTLATYARKGDRYRFYEINPEVLRMARAHFTYLADCQVDPEVEMGDARLSLERELSAEDRAPPRFDVLVLDAFSGDSIPAHLLTKEAFAIYRPHVAPGGVIAVHITNRFLYLAPVVKGLAEHCAMDTVRIDTPRDDSRAINHSDWMMLTNNADFLRAVKPSPPKEAGDDFTVPLWTDKYNNLFQILRRGS